MKFRYLLLALCLGVLSPLLASAQTYRGFNVSGLSDEPKFAFTRQELVEMKAAGANWVRLSFSRNNLGYYVEGAKRPEYVQFKRDRDGNIRTDRDGNPRFIDNYELMHRLIGWCEELELKCIIDIHTAFGQRLFYTILKTDPIWDDYKYTEQYKFVVQNVFKECDRYGQDVIFGIQVLNEPSPHHLVSDRRVDTNVMQRKLVAAARRGSKKHRIIIYQPLANFRWTDTNGTGKTDDDVTTFYAKPPQWFNTSKDPNVSNKIVYDFHMYNPVATVLNAPDKKLQPGKERVRWIYPTPGTNATRAKVLEDLGRVQEWRQYQANKGFPTRGDQFICGEWGTTQGQSQYYFWNYTNANKGQWPTNGAHKWMIDVYNYFKAEGISWAMHDWHIPEASGSNPKYNPLFPPKRFNLVKNMLKGKNMAYPK